ncbi:MAG: ATP-binding protein [Acidobacteria bacterium]|nr:ATP-binding protein [Acidobacteriota bacterium]
MMIAVSGTHCTGKTTLVEVLQRALPTYDAVDEPYYLLEEEGHEFTDIPSLEDFELQLDRSIKCITDSERDSIFDRCPADLLAYLFTHRESEAFDIDLWLPRIRRAMDRLDLIVFIPVEDPDRMIGAESEYGDLRRRVDEELREVLLDDRYGLGVDVLEVTGTISERVHQVLAHLNGIEA